MSQCVFCEIMAGKREAEIIYSNEYVAAFYGLTSIADVHVLVVPRKHIENIMDISDEDDQIIAEIHKAIKVIATKFGIHESGFRVITNTGKDGQQEVYHMHYHVIGGRKLKWEM